MTDVAAETREAVAVPQLPGTERPEGSVLYVCGGTNEFSKPCAKLLFVWSPGEAAARDGAAARECGRIEVKCRRCKTLNTVTLAAE